MREPGVLVQNPISGGTQPVHGDASVAAGVAASSVANDTAATVDSSPIYPGQEAPFKPGHEAPFKPGHEAPFKPGHEAPFKPSHEAPFKIANWQAYGRGLAPGCSLIFHLSPELTRCWAPQKTGKRGAPRRYSDAIIRLALFLRGQYAISWRQIESLLRSLVELLELEHLHVPDHTTLSRRSRRLEPLQEAVISPTSELHLVVNSDGLEIFEQRDWGTEEEEKTIGEGWKRIRFGVESGGQVVTSENADMATFFCGQK